LGTPGQTKVLFRAAEYIKMISKPNFQMIFKKIGSSAFDLAAAKITHNFHSMIIIELDEEEKPLKDRGEKCKFRPRCIAL
jgi:hypothetical protein